jgi:hypothetical protein
MVSTMLKLKSGVDISSNKKIKKKLKIGVDKFR